MRTKPALFAAMLITWALTAVACRGTARTAVATPDIVGTWIREHEGKTIQEITFTPDGRFDSVNPQTGAAKEIGTYSVAADGATVTFTGTDVATNASASYTWQVRFRGKDEFVWTTQGGRELTYHRKK
jgi:hypothetical protein